MSKLTEINVLPRCPDCGTVMYIPGRNRYFTCPNFKCTNTKKYKIPTIELEEEDE